MSKYYREEDIVNMMEQGFSLDIDGDKAYVIHELLPSLQTIQVSEDCISREWLVNRFKDKVEHYEMRIRRAKRYGKKTTYDTSEQIGYWKDEIADYKYIIGEIEGAPSVIPKAKEGEWINDIRYPGWTCTHCNYHNGNKTDNYCPNCGAKMKGVGDD